MPTESLAFPLPTLKTQDKGIVQRSPVCSGRIHACIAFDCCWSSTCPLKTWTATLCQEIKTQSSQPTMFPKNERQEMPSLSFPGYQICQANKNKSCCLYNYLRAIFFHFFTAAWQIEWKRTDENPRRRKKRPYIQNTAANDEDQICSNRREKTEHVPSRSQDPDKQGLTPDKQSNKQKTIPSVK